MKCMLHSMGSVRLLPSSFLPFHHAESILVSSLSISSRLLCHLTIISEIILFPAIPLIRAVYYYRFYSSTTSPPLRMAWLIPDDIRSIWGSMEPLKHSSGWLKGNFYYPTSYSAKTRCHDSKATATQPPSRPRPPRRHQTSPPSPPTR